MVFMAKWRLHAPQPHSDAVSRQHSYGYEGQRCSPSDFFGGWCLFNANKLKIGDLIFLRSSDDADQEWLK